MPNKARKNDMYHFAAPFYKAKAENAIPKVNVKISSTNQTHFCFILQSLPSWVVSNSASFLRQVFLSVCNPHLDSWVNLKLDPS